MALDALTNSREAQRDALASRLFEASIGALDLYAVYLGDRLNLYAALSETEGSNSRDLARKVGIHERYAREWLEQQASTGILTVDDPSAGPFERRYRLPDGHADVVRDRTGLSSLVGLLRLTIGVSRPLPALLEAYRTGEGVPYADYGADVIEGIAEMNRPMFTHFLGTEWLPAVPEMHARLLGDPPARVLDIGCGTGWSTLAIARAYPLVRVHGLDSDPVSIELARRHAADAGLGDRVSFSERDAANPVLAERFDLITAFETIHDMAQPVPALRSARELLAPGGSVIVADERVGDLFTAPGTDIERLNYGFSVVHCLPAGLAESPSAGTGTVMRVGTLRAYALEAGFSHLEVLPIENEFWQFYQLIP